MKESFVKLLGILLILTTVSSLVSCKKNILEPSLEGTWVEIDSTASQKPTGCELVINLSSGDVTLCGFNFIQPKNVVAIFAKKDAKLFAKGGQMFYRQKKADFLWIAPIAKEDLYFIDYDFEGQFLWIIGDNTNEKISAKGVGKLFKKK
ncbi:MAG: hypothetical protein Q8T03_11805 [Bacteroidota bacterium]|nr:hypothetical protein [Bacteroidota bacterium]